MYRVIAALFLLLASVASSSGQDLSPSVWQGQRGSLLKVWGPTLLAEISPASSSAALAAYVRVFPMSWRDNAVALGSYSRHREATLHGRIAQ